jgi:hypothetical protein
MLWSLQRYLEPILVAQVNYQNPIGEGLEDSKKGGMCARGTSWPAWDLSECKPTGLIYEQCSNMARDLRCANRCKQKLNFLFGSDDVEAAKIK